MLSGWVCDADAVEVELGHLGRQVAAYGTERLDTQAVCGDTDNGFGLLFNWNLLGEGEHEVIAYVDGMELGWATVRVTTLGEEFLREPRANVWWRTSRRWGRRSPWSGNRIVRTLSSRMWSRICLPWPYDPLRSGSAVNPAPSHARKGGARVWLVNDRSRQRASPSRPACASTPALVAVARSLRPVESQIAVGVAAGKTVRESAAALRRTAGSVYWYLNQISRKQGLTRQADVVRRVLSVPIRPAPWARGHFSIIL